MPRPAPEPAALLHSLIDLTGKSDLLSLNEAVLQHVTGLYPEADLRIYERPSSGAGWRLAGAAHIGHVISDRVDKEVVTQDLIWLKDLKECALLHHVPVEEGSAVLIPIRQGSIMISALILEGAGVNDWVTSIDPLLTGFCNLYLTLYRGSHDALTGLLNRQTFDCRMAAIVEYALDHREKIGGIEERVYYVIIDIDHFKKVNDTYGHLMGDEVLLQFARLMIQSFRSSDLMFRFGGEEFVVLLNDVSREHVYHVLNRFRMIIAGVRFPQAGQITCSIGYTALDIGVSMELVSERADKALYYAKDNGRDQVQFFEDLLESGKLEDATHDVGEVDLF